MASLSILLDNAHGGTYIVHAVATYSSSGSRHSVNGAVSGGLSVSMPPIPSDATDLAVELAFKGVFSDEHHHFNWPKPLTTFPGGQIIIDLRGVYPGATSAVERHTGTRG